MTNFHDRIELSIEDYVATVSFARPDKMNALDQGMFAAIPAVGKRLREESSVRAVIVTGQGGNFCAGLDKSNFENALSSDAAELTSGKFKLADRTHGIANEVQYLAWMWRELPMPVIAAIDGVALGGGLQIALGADIRVATSKARFSILELKWGIIPDMSSTQIMRHMIRDDVIRELTYTARIFDADAALNWGFITHIADDPLEHAQQIAQEIAQRNPQAVRAAKRVIDASYYQTQAEGLLMESVEQDKIMGSPNQIEAIMSVMQKRAPNFED